MNIGESGTLTYNIYIYTYYIYRLLLLGLGIIDSLTPPCCASSPRSGRCTCPLLACSNWENSTRKKSGLLMSSFRYFSQPRTFCGGHHMGMVATLSNAASPWFLTPKSKGLLSNASIATIPWLAGAQEKLMCIFATGSMTHWFYINISKLTHGDIIKSIGTMMMTSIRRPLRRRWWIRPFPGNGQEKPTQHPPFC